jgi:hypothetical protein
VAIGFSCDGGLRGARELVPLAREGDHVRLDDDTSALATLVDHLGASVEPADRTADSSTSPSPSAEELDGVTSTFVQHARWESNPCRHLRVSAGHGRRDVVAGELRPSERQ